MIRMLGSPNPPAVPPADGDGARRDRPDDRGAVAMSAAPACAPDQASVHGQRARRRPGINETIETVGRRAYALPVPLGRTGPRCG
jgi:hypothetical protein